MTDYQLKQLFEERKKAVKWANEAGFNLDRALAERYPFPFSETDNDEAIDTLDYGTSSMDFESFIEMIDEYKSENFNDEN